MARRGYAQIGHHLGECDQESVVTPFRVTGCKHEGRDGSEATAPGNSFRIMIILRWPATWRRAQNTSFHYRHYLPSGKLGAGTAIRFIRQILPRIG
jgi:hypothetical protein